jgi:anti-sigma regulatory factor (Ser/Thr protein kinase)
LTAELEKCLDFESDPALVRYARSFVRRTLREWEVEVFLDDAQLIASELVSNAVLHARTEVRLTLRSDGASWVRVEVKDHNSRMPTQLTCPVDATSGRGLAIVEELAASWGVTRDGDGKMVWADLGQQLTPGDEADCAEVRDLDATAKLSAMDPSPR